MKRYLKYLISPEALVPILIILVIGLVVIGLFSAKVKGFKELRKNILYYLLINVVITALFFLIVYNLKQTTVMFRYIFLQIYFIINGSIHVYLYKNTFNALKSTKIYIELFFALLTIIFLSIPLSLLIVLNNDFIYLYDFFFSLIAFIIPTLIYVFYNTSVSIPAPIYNKWYYPLSKKYQTASINEFKNMIVLNLFFYKDEQQSHLTKFKVKAPNNMNFGRLFYFFIIEYNEKNPGHKIQIFNESKEPFGWVFYTKPKWFSTTKRIDYEYSIENNILKDNDSIMCQRIIDELDIDKQKDLEK